MKINKVRFTEYDGKNELVSFELDTSDLSVDEYAELRFLAELCGLFDANSSDTRIRKGKAGFLVVLESNDSLRAAYYAGEQPDEVTELIEFLKDLRQSHVSYDFSVPSVKSEAFAKPDSARKLPHRRKAS